MVLVAEVVTVASGFAGFTVRARRGGGTFSRLRPGRDLFNEGFDMMTDYRRMYVIRMVACRTMESEPPLHRGLRIGVKLRLLSMLLTCLCG